jgi:hypothetical protein
VSSHPRLNVSLGQTGPMTPRAILRSPHALQPLRHWSSAVRLIARNCEFGLAFADVTAGPTDWRLGVVNLLEVEELVAAPFGSGVTTPRLRKP